MGITRYGSKQNSLFKSPPSPKVDYKDLKPISKDDRDDAKPAKYIMISGDKRLSPNNTKEILAATDPDNKTGEKVKVILISMAGSEGVDLKYIRQVHILEPWYNMSRLEQIIGRAVRNNSHKLLPFSERNVQIFLYGTLLKESQQEAADISIYRNAEYKAIQIGNVTRVLKEVSVDCFLNHEQLNFSREKMDQRVRQTLSDGTQIDDFQVGDKAYSMATDFMKDGEYKCYNTLDVGMNSSEIYTES